MPAVERLVSVVRAWVQKAEIDLKTAVLVLQAGEEGPAEAGAFHAQQCAEKYLKALLSWEGIDFPKTHDIGQLILLLPRKPQSILRRRSSGGWRRMRRLPATPVITSP